MFFATPIALLMYVDFTLSRVARFLSLRCVHITSIPYVRIGRIFDLKSVIAVSKDSSLMNEFYVVLIPTFYVYVI